MSTTALSSDPRRSFIGRLMGGAAALVALPLTARRADAAPTRAPAEGWLESVSRAKHKQVFDAPSINGGFPMMFSGAYLMTMKGAYDLKPGEAAVMLVLRHGAAVFVLNDAMWAKYKIGAVNTVMDAQTKQPAVRNPYVNAKAGDMGNPDFSIEKLAALGVTVVACNLALTKFSERFAASMGMKADDVLADWKANMVPGSFVAPSGVLAVGRAQEAGCTYCFAG